MAGKGNSLK